MPPLRYRRVIVKLSGRAFAGASPFGLDSRAIEHVADELIAARALGIEEAVVVGGGNFFRGNVAEEWGIERAEAYNIGMLGTVMNALMLRGALTARTEADIRVMTAVPILFAHAFLQTKTSEMIDSLETASVKFLNVLANRARTPAKIELARVANG